MSKSTRRLGRTVRSNKLLLSSVGAGLLALCATGFVALRRRRS